MGLFDFFKKKPLYDPNNITVLDMRTGFVFDYDLKSWQVIQAFEYEWRDGSVSFDFTIDNGTEKHYMSVEQDNGTLITIMDKIKIRILNEDLPEYIQQHEAPNKTLTYNGITYYLDEECVGTCFEEGEKEGADLVSWDYYDESGINIISIEQWGDADFEAYIGIVVKEFEISNILPATVN